MGAILLYTSTIVPGDIAAVTMLSFATGFASWCEGPFWARVIEEADGHVGAAGVIRVDVHPATVTIRTWHSPTLHRLDRLVKCLTYEG